MFCSTVSFATVSEGSDLQSIEENGGYYLDDGTWCEVLPFISTFDIGGQLGSTIGMQGFGAWLAPSNRAFISQDFRSKSFPTLTSGTPQQQIVTLFRDLDTLQTGFLLDTDDNPMVVYETNYDYEIPLSAIWGSVSGKYIFKYGIGSFGDDVKFEELPLRAEVTITAGDEIFYFTRNCSGGGFVDLSWAAPDGGLVDPLDQVRVIFHLSQYDNQEYATSQAYDYIGCWWYMQDRTQIRTSQSDSQTGQTLVDQSKESNNLLQELVSDVGSLGTRIVSGILDGLTGLFVPSAEDLEEINTNWQTMLETKLGFVWQAGTELIAIANAVIDEMEGGTPYAFVFPGISFPQNGEELVILPEMEVSLENDFMDVVRPILASVTIAVCVIAFINTAESMLAAIVSGASYYQFLHRKE